MLVYYYLQDKNKSGATKTEKLLRENVKTAYMGGIQPHTVQVTQMF